VFFCAEAQSKRGACDCGKENARRDAKEHGMAEQLTLDEVSRVAFLARLTTDLNGILGQFARLQELDTQGVPPTSHSLPLQNVLREDVVRPSLPREQATANATDKRDGNFIVPQIMEG